MGNPVVHFEIVGKDAPALRAFYREAFGWHVAEPMAGAGIADYTLVRPAEGAGFGEGIGGGIGASPQGYDGHATFYVQVADIVAALATIEARGGTRMIGPERVPGGPLIALFRDPEGHLVGLTQPGAAA